MLHTEKAGLPASAKCGTNGVFKHFINAKIGQNAGLVVGHTQFSSYSSGFFWHHNIRFYHSPEITEDNFQFSEQRKKNVPKLLKKSLAFYNITSEAS